MSGGKADAEALARALTEGSRRALARAITLSESTRPEHRATAERVLELLLPARADSVRLGISGVPGVGKSTFIEAFGQHVIGEGHRLAVLAVDPSSKRGGGAILGDKTRMAELSRSDAAFIRPSPAGETLGGVARRTREAILLCEAAGYDVVLVETVGVGQSETAVAEMVDMFLLLLLPGGGDELQGIKRGIVELADLLLVNKADGPFLEAARHTVADYRSALRLLRPASPAWRPEVVAVSALTGEGIPEAWEQVERHREAVTRSGERQQRRAGQARAALWAEIGEGLLDAFRADPDVAPRIAQAEKRVMAGRTTPGVAARALLAGFLGREA
jgi:LAO/AO transport system kinase